MGFHFKNMEVNEGRPAGRLGRQSSLYSLTFDEIQSTFGPGKDFGSMNMDEFLKNIWIAEETQAMASASASGLGGSSGMNMQKQASVTLPRTLSQKTVDEVWRDIFKECCRKDGSSKSESNLQQGQQTFGELTLEEFLMRAGVMREDNQPVGESNHNTGFYSGSVSCNSHVAGSSFGYAQPGPANTFTGSRMMEGVNNASCTSLNQVSQQSPKLPINMNGLIPQQQQVNQGMTAYTSSVSGGEVGLRGKIMRMGDSVIDKDLGQAGNGIQRGPGIGMIGLNAESVKVVPGSTANLLYSDSTGKRDRDASSSPGNPCPFNGIVRGRRSFGAVEKVVERRQRRMIKNRESAARSRARKQAYTLELEAEVSKLKAENQLLQKKQAEYLEMLKNQVLDFLGQQKVSKRRLLRTMTGPW